MDNRTYIAIDLKSFYASVECMERGLNPMTTNLVVADASRTQKTICLAVSDTETKHMPKSIRNMHMRESKRQSIATICICR